MKTCWSVALLAVILLLGCQEQAPPPQPPPQPPPEPSPQQIAEEMRSILAPMQGVLADPPVGTFTEEDKKAFLDALQRARTKNQLTDNGKRALEMVAQDVEKIISTARDKKRWKVVVGAIEAYEILSPGASTKLSRLKERAQLYINRPGVVLQGFVDDKEKKDTYAFLQVTLRPSMDVYSVQVKPGDEFHGLRFVDIVGDKKGVLLEYLKIPGDTWEVMTGR